MKIVFVGTGYVGLVSGTCLAEIGNLVTCVDNDLEKINALKNSKIHIYEEGLEALVTKNVNEGRLNFSSSVSNEISDADIIFIAVGTPSAEDGKADLKYVFSVADVIANNAKNGVIIVTKSTVPVGTGDKLKKFIQNKNPNLEFYIASNPEFLREGSAVYDFMNPDRILIGVDENDNNTLQKISKLYEGLTNKGFPIIQTDIRSAELAKYAANAYLAMRVGFINEIADLCEASNADISQVSKAIGMDKRIGSHFLKAGPAFGGSCFPKDTRAISAIAKEHNSELKIIDAVITSNENRKISMAEKIIKACNGDVRSVNIAILGTSFKANTDDIRESAALKIIEILARKGANLYIFDPKALENTKKYFAEIFEKENKTALDYNIFYSDFVADALLKSQLACVITEWNQFKNINFSLYKNLETIVDLRGIIEPQNCQDKKYITIGKN
ncbi:MAG: UDP-glucose/GDP-mannose dehydrogenase family protein [Rickettsiales bacterium]|nr:UDP-glucose/GDP-mannose dehydrogenase family protein [Rickettsiales bacterium]